MESVAGYTIIIILVILTVYFYNKRKKSTRTFILSEQHYPGVSFRINIRKEQGTISNIILNINNNKEIIIDDVMVELITKKREINRYDLKLINKDIVTPKKINPQANYNLELNFNAFKKLLSEGELPFRTFRFVVKAGKNQVFKSHELGINSRWIIYRPDTGIYN